MSAYFIDKWKRIWCWCIVDTHADCSFLHSLHRFTFCQLSLRATSWLLNVWKAALFVHIVIYSKGTINLTFLYIYLISDQHMIPALSLAWQLLRKNTEWIFAALYSFNRLPFLLLQQLIPTGRVCKLYKSHSSLMSAWDDRRQECWITIKVIVAIWVFVLRGVLCLHHILWWKPY